MSEFANLLQPEHEPMRRRPGKSSGARRDRWFPWSDILFDLAAHHGLSERVIADWELRSVLKHVEVLAVDRALAQFRHAQLLFAAGAMKDAPRPPAILLRSEQARA